jgi:K+-transporting ATPase ATPase C chain
MRTLLRQSTVMLVLLTLITGIAYPLLVTGLAQAIFPHAANGSLIEKNGRIVGSELIGQAFADPKYFWSRPSATSPFANNSAASSGSNLGPNNSALADAVRQRIDALRKADPGNTAAVPIDLVTASASGLDPHISPAAAAYQIGRVARVRGMAEQDLRKLVAAATERRTFGVLGEPRVNVLALNLALDAR